MGCASSDLNNQDEMGTFTDSRGGSKESDIVVPPDLPHVFKEHYKLGDVLGEGGYSIVKLGTHKYTSKKVAVKIVTRANLTKSDDIALRQEVEILKDLKHRNIVQCFDFFEEEKFYYVILEFMAGGELFDRIVQKSFYNEKEARDVVQIILQSIAFCHDRNIVHRDLKPENLLLPNLDNDNELKLADFGFAIKTGDNNLQTQCGTPGYVAPEILSNRPYGPPVDMWSIGVITYILLGGYPPFHDENQATLFKKIKQGKFEFHPSVWDAVSDDAKDLISKLLTVDPTKRLTAHQALKHKWINTSADILANKNLEAGLAEFKKFHAKRKLKAAVKTVMFANKMQKMLGGARSANASTASADIEPIAEGEGESNIEEVDISGEEVILELEETNNQ